MPNDMDFAVGTYVFSSDGVEVGEIAEVTRDSIVVNGADGPPVRVQLDDIDAMNAGRLLLRVTASQLTGNPASSAR